MSQETFQFVVNISGGCLILVQTVCFFVLWRIFYSEHNDTQIQFTALQRHRTVTKSSHCGQSAAPGCSVTGFAEAGILIVLNLLIGFWPGISSGIRYLVSAALILAGVFVRYRKYLEKAVFVLLMFYNFHGLSFLIANSIYQYGTDFLFHQMEPSSKEYLSEIYLSSAWCQWLLVIVYGLIFLAMVGILQKIVTGAWEMNWQDAVFLSSLNGAGILLARTVMDLSVVKMEQGMFLLFDEKKDMLWKVPLIALLLYLGELSAIYIFQKYGKLQRERQKHFMEEQQMKLLRQRLEEAEDFYGSIRRARHEMKNHMANLKGLAAGGNYQAAEQYVKKLEETMGTLEYQFATGNPVTDVVINDKYRKAVVFGIDFRVNFHYGPKDGVSVFDLGILLGNLLDNAIEACQRMKEGRRFIRLNLRRKNHFLLIEVENSFDGILRWEEGSPVPATRKKESLTGKKCSQRPGNAPAAAKQDGNCLWMEHGIGLTNVKEIAERYLGVMEMKINGNVFQVVVMLQQSDERSDGSSQ